MAITDIQLIQLENLKIDLSNPRNEMQISQRDAMAAIAKEQGIKLVKLAEDIAERGLDPGELPYVTATAEKDIFTVVEGNRRITAIKLSTSQKLLESIDLPKNIVQRFKKIIDNPNKKTPLEVVCTIVSAEEALHWIFLKHTGENEGVGVVNWNGAQTQRFRGNSPALQAVDYVKDSDYIDEDTRQKLYQIPITNVQRFLSTPEARKMLGLDIEKGQLIFLGDKEESIGRLSIVIGDIAQGRKKVSDIETKSDRIKYAQEVVSQSLPSKQKTNTGNGTTSGTTSTTPKTGKTKAKDAERKTIIPKQFKISISHTRINQIYRELQKLEVQDYPNSCAVMLRVFIELSVDHFAQLNNIPLQIIPKPSGGSKANPPAGKLQPKDMNLRTKLTTVADFLEDNQLSTKAELFGVRALVNNTVHFLSVDSLNAYVHNMSYNPAISDLKAHWDSIQVFVEKLWA